MTATLLKPSDEEIQKELDRCKNAYQQLVVLDKYALATDNQKLLRGIMKISYGPAPKSSFTPKQLRERKRLNKQTRKSRRINQQ